MDKNFQGHNKTTRFCSLVIQWRTDLLVFPKHIFSIKRNIYIVWSQSESAPNKSSTAPPNTANASPEAQASDTSPTNSNNNRETPSQDEGQSKPPPGSPVEQPKQSSPRENVTNQ